LLERGRLKGPRRRLQKGDDARRRRRRPARTQGFLPALPSALTVHKKAPRNRQSCTLPTRGQHLIEATEAAVTTSSITPATLACCRPSFLISLQGPGRAPRERPAPRGCGPRPRSYLERARRPRSDPDRTRRPRSGLVRLRRRRADHAPEPPHHTNSSQRSSPCASKLDGWPSWPVTGARLLSDSAANHHHRDPPPLAQPPCRTPSSAAAKEPAGPATAKRSRSVGSAPPIPVEAPRLETSTSCE
jgi:hypothetical protein